MKRAWAAIIAGVLLCFATPACKAETPTTYATLMQAIYNSSQPSAAGTPGSAKSLQADQYGFLYVDCPNCTGGGGGNGSVSYNGTAQSGVTNPGTGDEGWFSGIYKELQLTASGVGGPISYSGTAQTGVTNPGAGDEGWFSGIFKELQTIASTLSGTLNVSAAESGAWTTRMLDGVGNTLSSTSGALNVHNDGSFNPGVPICKPLAVITATGATVIKNTPGYFCGVKSLDTAAAQPGATTCYDNASAASGKILDADVLGAPAVGSGPPYPLTTTNGITCNESSTPTAAGIEVYGD